MGRLRTSSDDGDVVFACSRRGYGVYRMEGRCVCGRNKVLYGAGQSPDIGLTSEEMERNISNSMGSKYIQW